MHCNRSCLGVFATAGGRAGGVRTLLQPARAQCLRLSERFFHLLIYFSARLPREKSDTSSNVSGQQGLMTGQSQDVVGVSTLAAVVHDHALPRPVGHPLRIRVHHLQNQYIPAY